MFRSSHSLRPLVHLGLVAALVVAGGGHWVLLQSVAWTGMLVRYAHTAPTLAAAVTETFDGQHPCGLCLEIQQRKQAERQTPATLASSHVFKLTLFLQPTPLAAGFFTPAGLERQTGAPAAPLGIGADRPPVPPPRAA